MHVSTWILMGIGELYLVLMAITLFLLIHSRKLKQLSSSLQARVKKLVKDLKKARAEVKDIKAQLDPCTAYKKQINDQIEITRAHHDSLQPDQDIALDLDTSVSIERQTAALRHAILIAEKEAIHSSENEKPNWDVLKSKLSLLMDFYKGSQRNKPAAPETAAASEDLDELNTYKQRVENLEKFKQLYFDLEKEWQAAQDKAGEYQMQLSSYANQVDDADSFEAILASYENAYSGIGSLVQTIKEPGKTHVIEKVKVVHGNNNSEKAHASELDRLRNVAVDQHRTINELKKRLANAATADAKELILKDLQRELDQQARFVKEAETCIKLLEDELDSANNRLSYLENKAAQKDKSLGDYTRMENALKKADAEKQQLLKTQAALENEISQLEALFEHAGAAPNGDADKELKKLQADYAALEERYLNLKMK